jgi:hypothetical protein
MYSSSAEVIRPVELRTLPIVARTLAQIGSGPILRKADTSYRGSRDCQGIALVGNNMDKKEQPETEHDYWAAESASGLSW